MQWKFDLIRWTPDRVRHIARHGVMPEEADEALHDERAQLHRSRAGRRLVLVPEDEGARVAGLVTARDASATERKRYRD